MSKELQKMPLSLVVTAGSALAVALAVQFWMRPKKKAPLPPLAKQGMLESLRQFTGLGMREFLIQQFQEMGEIYRLRLPTTAIVVANTEDARAILTNPKHGKPSFFYKTFNDITSGPSILTKNGDQWHHRRKGMNPAFAPKHIKRMNMVAVEKAQEWATTKLVDGATFDVGAEMILLTISVICKAGFDYDLEEHECVNTRQAIKDTIEEFTFKSSVNPLRRLGTWFLPERQQAFRSAQYLSDFATKLISLYRKQSNPPRDTILDLILKNQNYANDSERISDIILLLAAGHDTTGYTMAFVLMELARNPAEQQKVRQECAKDDDSYLRAVISEAIRLYPASSFMGVRQLASDVMSHSGKYLLPKGCLVFLMQVSLSRDPSIYPNPNAFDPSRWLDGNVTEAMRQAQMPFSFGSRNCVGQPLAMAELRSVVPLILQKVELSVEKEGRVITKGTTQIENCILKAKVLDSTK